MCESTYAASFFKMHKNSQILKFYMMHRDIYRYGPVAQRITRLTTDQEIAGSNPAWVVSFCIFHRMFETAIIFYLTNIFKFIMIHGFLNIRIT